MSDTESEASDSPNTDRANSPVKKAPPRRRPAPRKPAADTPLPVARLEILEGESLSGDVVAAVKQQQTEPVQKDAPIHHEPAREAEAPSDSAPHTPRESAGPEGSPPGDQQRNRDRQPDRHNRHQNERHQNRHPQQGQQNRQNQHGGGRPQQGGGFQQRPQNQQRAAYSGQGQGQGRPQQQQGYDSGPRRSESIQGNFDEVATKAWEIYYTEIGQDGVSMFNDMDAQKLAQRSVRLAEIFLRELYAKKPRPGGEREERASQEDSPRHTEAREEPKEETAHTEDEPEASFQPAED